MQVFSGTPEPRALPWQDDFPRCGLHCSVLDTGDILRIIDKSVKGKTLTLSSF